MSYKYGNTVNVAGYTNKYWRAVLYYTVSSTNTTYTVSCKSGFAFTNSNYEGSADHSSTISGDRESRTGSWTVPMDGTVYIQTKTKTYDKKTSSYKQTISFSSYIGGSFCPGTSSGSIEITIPALESYSISFNKNGGTGSIASRTKYYGKSLTLPSSGFTRSGYELDGWAKSASGSKAYSLGGSYTTNSSTTLYAHWKNVEIKPRIISFSVERYDSVGPNDEGNLAHAFIKYSGSSSGGAQQSLTYTLKFYSGSTVYYSTTGSLSTISPDQAYTQEISIPSTTTFDINTSYAATIAITAGGSTTPEARANLSTAIFPIDILADGSSVGIMMPAQNGWKVSMPQLKVGPMPGTSIPIYAKGSGAYAYYGVKNNLGETLGGIGVGSDYRPRFWDANSDSSSHITINSFATTGTDAQFVVETYSEHSSKSVGTSGVNATYNISKPNYYPLGVVGFYVSNANVLVRGCYLNNIQNGSATINYYMRSVSGTNTVTQTTRVLWVKI